MGRRRRHVGRRHRRVPGASAAVGTTYQVPATVEQLVAEVNKCKAVLEGSSPPQDVVAALDALAKMGSLPTKVLSDTLIGKVVNNIAKGSVAEPVRTRAREVVEEWRHARGGGQHA